MVTKIAITGGICSGKTAVCHYLEDLGYVVMYSDIIAIHLAENNQFLREEIIKEFGKDSYNEDKSYNRPYVAKQVFGNKERLEKLNSIFLPYLNDMFDYITSIEGIYENNGKDVLFYESALIFEHNIADKFDSIICMYANQESIIQRLKNRNGYNDEEIKNRLDSQMDPLEKVKLSDYLIDTTNNEYKDQVNSILDKILI